MRPECEWCDSDAELEVHAQWTIADCLDWVVCRAHRLAAHQYAQRTLIDGHPPLEVIEWW